MQENPTQQCKDYIELNYVHWRLVYYLNIFFSSTSSAQYSIITSSFLHSFGTKFLAQINTFSRQEHLLYLLIEFLPLQFMP